MTETLPKEVTAARLAYANARERMGMAHANGTRKQWQDAVDEEVATRRELDAALLSALREAREHAIEDAAKVADAYRKESMAAVHIANEIRELCSAPRSPGREARHWCLATKAGRIGKLENCRECDIVAEHVAKELDAAPPTTPAPLQWHDWPEDGSAVCRKCGSVPNGGPFCSPSPASEEGGSDE